MKGLEADMLDELAVSPQRQEAVKACLVQTIRRPAIQQALKGVLSTGIVHSVRYASRKLRKGQKTQ